MKGTGRMIYNMGLGLKSIKMVVNTRVDILKERNKEQENTHMQMDQIILDNGLTINLLDLE